MPGRLDVPVLIGRLVALEPLAQEHLADLTVAAADRATYGFTAVPAGREEMARYVRGLLDAHAGMVTIPFAQRALGEGRVVGVTRYLTLRAREGEESLYAVEIGGTWLTAWAQGTGINSEAKLLLLTHAFEAWGVARVDLKTDARNAKARAAILRLGATFEGVLRAWQPSQVAGEERLLRDSALYSILREEWPSVRAALELRCAGS